MSKESSPRDNADFVEVDEVMVQPSVAPPFPPLPPMPPSPPSSATQVTPSAPVSNAAPASLPTEPPAPYQPGYSVPENMVPSNPTLSAPPPTGMPLAMSAAPMPTVPMDPAATQPNIPIPTAPAVPAMPNPFVMALTNLWWVMKDVWSGKTDAAFKRPAEVASVTGSQWANWLVPFLATSLALGLLVPAIANTTMRDAYRSLEMFGYFVGSSSLPLDLFMKIMFVCALMVFGTLILRALAVMLAVKIGGGTATFTGAATTVGVAQTLMWLPLLVATFLTLLLNMFGIAILVVIGLGGVGLMVELLTYVGVTRMGSFKNSPLVAYAWLTITAGVLAFLAIVFLWGSLS